MPPSTRGESYVPDGSIDVGSLEGDALARWYLRSPADIEQERQTAAAKRYQDVFYGPSGTDPDPGFAREMPSMDHDVEPNVPRPGARPLKPDLGTPPRGPADAAKRYYLELKPNTPTGRAAAARAVKKYFDATGRPVRPIYYDPKDFI
jgi:hypothetical protein